MIGRRTRVANQFFNVSMKFLAQSFPSSKPRIKASVRLDAIESDVLSHSLLASSAACPSFLWISSAALIRSFASSPYAQFSNSYCSFTIFIYSLEPDTLYRSRFSSCSANIFSISSPTLVITSPMVFWYSLMAFSRSLSPTFLSPLPLSPLPARFPRI